MPVEINELVIKATISTPETPQQATLSVSDNSQKLQQILDEVVRKIDKKGER